MIEYGGKWTSTSRGAAKLGPQLKVRNAQELGFVCIGIHKGN